MGDADYPRPELADGDDALGHHRTEVSVLERYMQKRQSPKGGRGLIFKPPTVPAFFSQPGRPATGAHICARVDGISAISARIHHASGLSLNEFSFTSKPFTIEAGLGATQKIPFCN